MKDTDIPYKFAQPWAASAASGYSTDPIPATSTGAAAGQDLGFPPITAQPVAAGGVPPNIADFNGLGFYVTAWTQWQQSGAPVFYDSTFSGAIGGYPKGTLLRSAVTANVVWRSTVDDNTSDPDTGGANWVNDFLASLVANGYQELPSGFIIQFQRVTTTIGMATSFNYPKQYPNACLSVIATMDYNSSPPPSLTVQGPAVYTQISGTVAGAVATASATLTGDGISFYIISVGF